MKCKRLYFIAFIDILGAILATGYCLKRKSLLQMIVDENFKSSPSVIVYELQGIHNIIIIGSVLLVVNVILLIAVFSRKSRE